MVRKLSAKRTVLAAAVLSLFLMVGVSLFPMGAAAQFQTYYGYGCPSWSRGATAHAYDIWGTSLDSVTFVFHDGAVSYATAYYQGGGHFTASTSYPFSSVYYLYFNYHNPPGGHSEWLQCY